MSLTAQDYQNALTINREFDGVVRYETYRDFLSRRALELSNPEPKFKQYRCINNSYPFLKYIKGAVNIVAGTEYDYSLFPFHFELIPEPVKEEPITWEGLIDIMLKCNWGTYSSTAEAIVKRIKSDHNL